jgi:indolepyruvate ferredoxin oxidoreductase, beta subunit
MNAQDRPITLLIAALGGEGGGVLTQWIVEAAAACGLPAQSTSIPGVAQRTGATTYYIEILPTAWAALDARRPVLSLVPGIGDIDVMIASELLEAGRAIAAGFVTPDRTTLVASTHRIYAISERMAMGDGRIDIGHLLKTIEAQAQSQVLFDMEATAQGAGSAISAVMLGALAGAKRLPIPREAFEAAIRAEGKSVEANLRGFTAGIEAVEHGGATAETSRKRHAPAKPDLGGLERTASETMPAAALDVVHEGLRRLAAYQDTHYARLYLDRLGAIRDADRRLATEGRLLKETARHLAIRMSFEDVIRVAEVKRDPARIDRIRREMRLAPDAPLAVIDFFKPGIEELCSVLPAPIARRALAVASRRGWLGKAYWGMQVQSTSVSGFLRLTLLAKLKRWRPRSYRFVEEQAQIEAWLDLVLNTAQLSADLALEVAECARLIKGYGDTHARGLASFRKIETRVIRPALSGGFAAAAAVDAVAAARMAALADPDGERLDQTLAEIDRRVARRVAAE